MTASVAYGRSLDFQEIFLNSAYPSCHIDHEGFGINFSASALDVDQKDWPTFDIMGNIVQFGRFCVDRKCAMFSGFYCQPSCRMFGASEALKKMNRRARKFGKREDRKRRKAEGELVEPRPKRSALYRHVSEVTLRNKVRVLIFSNSFFHIMYT